ncbi:hypothetical protein CMI38_07015 [Candidatus Pacearchaeota archaeon]|nr:hypothetical protein [Candidatus Pacearchaeota archaeon]|tara:strand:+ start:3149 stop:3676 length:528 start_codon:yes stop_codon:yes gene_type:complete
MGYKTKIVVTVMLMIIIGIIAYFIFFREIEKESKIINCGEVPADFDMQNPNYLEENPEVKKSFECSSVNFRDCKPSKITYLGTVVNMFYVKGIEGDKCIVNYESRGKGIECKYTLGQVKQMYEVAEENGQAEMTSFAVIFGLGFEIMKHSPGGTSEQEMINRDTGEKEKILCRFY